MANQGYKTVSIFMGKPLRTELDLLSESKQFTKYQALEYIFEKYQETSINKADITLDNIKSVTSNGLDIKSDNDNIGVTSNDKSPKQLDLFEEDKPEPLPEQEPEPSPEPEPLPEPEQDNTPNTPPNTKVIDNETLIRIKTEPGRWIEKAARLNEQGIKPERTDKWTKDNLRMASAKAIKDSLKSKDSNEKSN